MQSKKSYNQKDLCSKQNRLAKKNPRVYRCVPEISKYSFAMPLIERFLHSFVIHDYSRI